MENGLFDAMKEKNEIAGLLARLTPSRFIIIKDQNLTVVVTGGRVELSTFPRE